MIRNSIKLNESGSIDGAGIMPIDTKNPIQIYFILLLIMPQVSADFKSLAGNFESTATSESQIISLRAPLNLLLIVTSFTIEIPSYF